MLRRVAVLASESEVASPDEQAAGQRAGRTLAENGVVVVTSGFGFGPVGTVADAVVAASGRVVGVALDELADDALHPGLGECRRVADRGAQLRELALLADAFLLLPGAVATLGEILALKETGAAREIPFGLLDEGGAFSVLLGEAADETLDQFIRHSQRGAISLSRDLGELLLRMRNYRPPEQRRPEMED
jgi:predicted Rossmann-fold nucleotide-binding protein